MSLYSDFNSCSDKKWLEILSGNRSSFSQVFELITKLTGTYKESPLPKFPDSHLQESFVGSSGAKSLIEAFKFYQLIKKNCCDFGKPISPDSKILDFGCGWGRITRFFLKDVYAENLVGVDVDAEIIKVCRETIPEGKFEAISPTPSVQLPKDSFDVIFAYSVFSHLAEQTHLLWIEHFSELLKDGGLLFLTTQKRSFIEYCNNLTKDQLITPWHKTLSRAFRPLDKVLSHYDKGEFVYSPTGGGGVREASFYGEAAFSESYAKNKWSPYFELLSCDEKSLPQALMIAQKRTKK